MVPFVPPGDAMTRRLPATFGFLILALGAGACSGVLTPEDAGRAPVELRPASSHAAIALNSRRDGDAEVYVIAVDGNSPAHDGGVPRRDEPLGRRQSGPISSIGLGQPARIMPLMTAA